MPIELVTIAVSPSADLTDSTYFNVLATVNTLPNGQFTVSDLAAGDYGLTAFFAGKKLERRVVKIDKVDIMLSIILEDLETSLEEITVDAENQGAFGLKRLRAVERDGIYDAKKNEVVVIDEITANLATNNSRQVYAKVAGLNIWESDGAGIQLGIGGRGLSPNRSSNFNTRQNGYDIAADALGYPESYYTPPVQALQSIEVIRGAASLQYGTQFGGVINFRFREGDADKPFSLTSMQTLGAFGLFNSFNSLGGTAGKINYYAFYQRKQSDGWRPNEGLNQDVVYGALRYAVTPAWSIKGEYTYMSYLAQQPGGLTDTQFADNPRQSNRERNWFAVDWNLFALSSDYALSGRTNLNTRFFALRAGRDALGNLGRIDRIDFGGNRDFISDRFSNWGNETRFIHRYPLLNDFSVLLLGMRYYKGFTDRMQGEGSAENDAVFEYNNPTLLEGSDFDLPNTNFSFFAEKILNMGPKLSFVPGARFEYIRTEAEGYYRNTVRDLAGNILLDEQIDEVRDRTRSFVFFGLGASYKESPSLEFYSNISQNYRAINFNDIRVSVGRLEVDPDIQDERGFNVELGARGASYGLLNYDISLFHLAYKDRIGTVLRSEPNPQFNNLVDRIFRYRTNVADASIYGLELYAEFDVLRPFLKKNNRAGLSLFTNFALIQATYSDSDEPGIEGNDVELVPRYNLKTGVTVTHGNFELAWQIALVDEQFSDATNAARTPTAIEGLIPAYNVMDISSRYTFNRFRLEAGINNLADTRYFTRRATGYPGPGIIPSVGRSWYLSAGVKL
ncbi:MAG: TonB-dependent receptor [Bacteroidota bacterium]